VRERPAREQDVWAARAPVLALPPPAIPVAPSTPLVPAPPPIGTPPAPPEVHPPPAASGFPTTMQLVAVLVVAAVLVAGFGIYLFRSNGATGATPSSSSAGPAVAVVHDGAAVLASRSLSGGATAKSLQLPGAPNAIVITPDGTKGFLLDTDHGQVIPVDLAHGTVGAPIPAGKLPTDEEMSADGATLYVTDNLGGSMIPIDTASGTPGPAQQLAQGVTSFVPAPTGSTAVVGANNAPGQPGILGFYAPTSGLASAVAVGLNSPNELFYSPDGATVWVTEEGVGSLPGVVIPVDVRSHAVGKAIPVGHGPAGSAMSSDGHLLLVSNSLDRSVSVVDLVARAVVATVPVGAGPVRVVFSADGSAAWVACALDRTLVPIDRHSDRPGTPIALASAPADLAIPRGTTTAWVLLQSSAGNVTFLAGDKLGHPTQVGNGPNLIIAHNSSSAWVANSLSDTVQRVDGSGRAGGSPIHVPRTPGEMALTRDQKRLLVLSFGDGSHAGFLTAVDTASSKAGTPLAVGVAPASLTLAPDGTTAYVDNYQTNSITTVDLKKWQVSTRISLPCSASHLVITPDGATVYADCSASSEVLPVTTSGHSVGAPIVVGAGSEMVMGNQGKTIFVKEDHALQEIDVATDKVVLSHGETGNIVSITPTPDDSTLVAVENTGGALLLLKSATLATMTSVSVGSRPEGLALSTDGSRAYVLDTSQQKLYVVDVVAANVATIIDVSPNATSVVVPSLQP
jgi:YVTN family beta-propeller protein